MMSRNTRAFEFKLGKRGLILFIFGISLFLFFAYVFGVMVGKNIDTYPEKLSRGIPDMVKKRMASSPDKTETAVVAREGAGGSSTGEDNDFDLTFYDTLTRKGDKQKGLPKNPPQSEQEKRLPPPVVAEHTGEETHPVKGKYLIQVVSYREKEKADRFCKRLKALEYNPMVVTIELPGKGKWFRVILEGFETYEEAQKVVGIVSKEIGGLSCVIHSTNRSRDSGIRSNKDSKNKKKVSQGE